MKRLLFLLALAASFAVQAQHTMTVDMAGPTVRIEPTMYGIFFEDINFGADGGLYAELVKNRSFEFPQALVGWIPFGDVTVRQEAGTEKRSQPSAGNEAGNRTTCRLKTKERQGHLIRQDYQRLAVYLESKVMFR